MKLQTSPRQHNQSVFIGGIIAIAMLVLIIGGMALSRAGKDLADVPESAQATDDRTGSDNESPDSKRTYADGAYSGSGAYTSPGGTETVRVAVTLRNGKVTDVAVTANATSKTSKQYQESFRSGYKALVVGKDIAGLKLAKVSGSSLTSQGFNAAIQQIRQQAQQLEP